MGYHLKEITKGKIGESSKIREELEELEDAEAQDNKVLAICELSDLYGAIEQYILAKFGGELTMKDLKKMARATAKAFQDGSRK